MLLPRRAVDRSIDRLTTEPKLLVRTFDGNSTKCFVVKAAAESIQWEKELKVTSCWGRRPVRVCAIVLHSVTPQCNTMTALKNCFLFIFLKRQVITKPSHSFDVEGFYFERPIPDDTGSKQPFSRMKLRCYMQSRAKKSMKAAAFQRICLFVYLFTLSKPDLEC